MGAERGWEDEPARGSWLPVLQATIAFAAAGGVITGYGLVLQPAWFDANHIPSTASDNLLLRTLTGILMGAVLGLCTGTLRRAVPGPWSLYGTFSGLILAGSVHGLVVVNPHFPRPWLPGLSASSPEHKLGLFTQLVRWMTSGGWVAVLVGLLFGVLVALWHDAQVTPREPPSSPRAGW